MNYVLRVAVVDGVEHLDEDLPRVFLLHRHCLLPLGPRGSVHLVLVDQLMQASTFEVLSDDVTLPFVF